MNKSLIEIQAGYDEPMEDNLTWLTRNRHEWPEGTNVAFVTNPDEDGQRNVAFLWYSPGVPLEQNCISKNQWQQRRAQLQNKPSWDDAPEWANWLAQDSNGKWFFYSHECAPEVLVFESENEEVIISIGVEGEVLGDWRNTLEKRPESKPDQIPQPAPSLQYRTEDVAFNSMDQMCGPEAYHRINHSEQPLDMVKQERYKDANGEDWIDEFARTSTVEEFRGAMKFTIGKYNRRVGKKDEIIKEIRKMKDYCHRWELYELGLNHD